ncbi:hypothetical protein [Tahibacter amnicola]|uniref:Uncharacterized protein n=1 Tax=Tahibacter amnicola TaxID=2976241 RepID=A0ABY6BIJ5_9GAMM|nr:hypothetical protein [Tahibacter amnicola]UXI68915.1 hypothetical protein N4264_04460 [Tahibacter amnicola]
MAVSAKGEGLMGPAGGASAAATAWRTRWFWRWQAWRAHRQAHHEQGGNPQFDSYSTLDQQGYADPLIALARQLDGTTPGLVAESALAMQLRLIRELGRSGCAVVLPNKDGSLGGYSWGRTSPVAEAMSVYRHVATLAHLRSEDWQAAEQRAVAVCRDELVLALHGIGLIHAFRKGFAPLKQLLKPQFDMALRQSVRRVVWWTPRSGPLAALSTAFGAHRLHETDAAVFFALTDIRPLAQVFAHTPASDIAQLIGRVAALRTAPTVVTEVNGRRSSNVPA